MTYPEKHDFLFRLTETQVFDDATKTVIERACELETLPLTDYQYIFDVLKLEANMNYILEEKTQEQLDSLKKKYGK